MKCLRAVPLVCCLATLHAAEPVATGEFTKLQLTDQFWAEGAAFGDFDKDGKMDVVYGPYWWAGPDFKKRRTIYPDTVRTKVKKEDGSVIEVAGYKGALGYENGYSDNFVAYAHDFNGDGWADVLVLGFPGKESVWYENPKGADTPWAKHVALEVTDNESPTFLDLTGDGKPEIVCNSGGFWGFAEPNWNAPHEKWKWRNISPKGPWERFTHGLGVGDVNGDGRMDLLEAGGWWEQPKSLEGDPVWTRHEFQFGPGGAQMFAYDVNGDGRNDVITSLEAHGYGVAWFEQTDDGGAVGFTKHVIVGEKAADNPQGVQFTQPHALDLFDMNGDGLKDLVTGKRFWAHGPKGDKEPGAAPVLYWFELKRAGGKAQWLAHLIDDASGVGTQVMAGDLNADGKPDVVMGNKRGAFVFLRK